MEIDIENVELLQERCKKLEKRVQELESENQRLKKYIGLNPKEDEIVVIRCLNKKAEKPSSTKNNEKTRNSTKNDPQSNSKSEANKGTHLPNFTEEVKHNPGSSQHGESVNNYNHDDEESKDMSEETESETSEFGPAKSYEDSNLVEDLKNHNSYKEIIEYTENQIVSKRKGKILFKNFLQKRTQMFIDAVKPAKLEFKKDSMKEKDFDTLLAKISYEIKGVGFKYLSDNHYNAILFIDETPQKPQKEKLRENELKYPKNFRVFNTKKISKYLGKIDSEDVCFYIHPL